MNCDGVIRDISNYLDGELAAAIRAELEAHLEECEGCMIVVRQTRYTIEIFCNEQSIELPTEVRTRLHETLRRKIRNPGT